MQTEEDNKIPHNIPPMTEENLKTVGNTQHHSHSEHAFLNQPKKAEEKKYHANFIHFTKEEMESKSKIKYDVNCEERAGFFSKLTFAWTGDILSKGGNLEKQGKYLQSEDLYDCAEQEQPLFSYNFMEEHLISQIRQYGKTDIQEEAEYVRQTAILKQKNASEGQKGIKSFLRPLRQRKIVEKVLNMLGYKTFMIACAFAIVANVLQFAGPILLNRILVFLSDSNDEPSYYGYIYASLIFICYFIRTFLLQHSLHQVNFVGIKVLNGLSSAIFTKIMRVSSSTRKYFDAGRTMNLVSVDSQTIFIFLMMGTFMLSSPVMIVVSMVLIVIEIGPIGLVTPVFFFIGAFFQSKINAASFALRRVLLGFTDKRSKAVNEFFEGIRVIKYYAWEEMVSERIFNIRKGELDALIKSQILKSLIEVTMNVTPLMISILVFGLYSALYDDFTPAKAFMVLSLFNLLLIPLRMVTMVLMFYLNAKASMTRIEFFLSSEEREDDIVIRDDPNQQTGAVSITNGNFSWDSFQAAVHNEQGNAFMKQGAPPKKPDAKDQKAKPEVEEDFNKLSPLEEQSLKNLDILKNINFDVKPGEMVAIVGQVASGKSSILQALLGEMMKQSGDVKIKGSVAYVPQTAWLQNATLRDNILFGKPFDEKRYNMVIDRSQLRQEIENGEVLPGGDQTEIGERGINLSGGQKQRVAIARALYADADVYLIDDCLSALDAHVGKNVFEQVLKGELKSKTVIFVTHALHYMPDVERIVVMKEGTVVESGTHQYLRKNGPEYIRLNQIIEKEEEEEVEKSRRKSSANGDGLKEIEINFEAKAEDEKNPNKSLELVKRKSSKPGDTAEEAAQKIEKKAIIGKTVQKEERATGAVPGRVYKKYLSQSGIATSLTMFLMFLLAQGCKMIGDWWIGEWSANSYPDLSTGTYIWVYALICVATGIFIFLRGYQFGIFSLTSSSNFQKDLLHRLLHTPLWWFDITPTGRIVARTSKDQDDLDTGLPWNMQYAIGNVIQLIATCVMISVILPLFLIVFFVSFIIYVKIIQYYLISAREIRRIEANTRAPVISHFQESINGLYVIRAFGKEREFIERMLLLQRNYVVSFTNMNYTNRWISVMTDLFALVIISGTAYFGVLSRDFSSSSSSSVGLALSWSFQISSILSFTLKLVADTESGMNAVVRMMQYIDNNPQEKSWREKKAPANWPSSGEYQLQNITYKYREELPTVINNISFDIKKSQKIGVVGRTGSGKSTMTLGLMRILELIPNKDAILGSIKLDSQDISEIGLHELRDKVTIIPQDPLLFSGSIKSNIDPFNKHSNAEIAEVLKKVEIWDQLTLILEKQMEKESKDKKPENNNNTTANNNTNNNPNNTNQTNNPNLQVDQVIQKKLDIKVEGGGSNFSLGQRQLICIARAIIKKPNVLLMDEATASIDEMTDRLIQNMIKKELTNTTVITIAHRLKTIIQYDKILVLDIGNLKEFDSPINLLQDKQGYFHKLIESHGPSFFEEMKTLATNKDLDVY